jgi:hypothetical protein
MLIEELGIYLEKGDVVKIEYTLRVKFSWYVYNIDTYDSVLTYKDSNGYCYKTTRDASGNELTTTNN